MTFATHIGVRMYLDCIELGFPSWAAFIFAEMFEDEMAPLRHGPVGW